MSKVYGFNIETTEEGLFEITSKVKEAVIKSEVEEGICVVYCPHTTAGITINENADSDVVHDMMLGLNQAFLDRVEFLHGEGNSSAHIKASVIGASETLIISERQLLLGKWQGVYFAEFDGPKRREFLVKVLSC